MKIEILDLARQDILDGIAFYEKQSEGAGRYFFHCLMADIESLHLYAGIHVKDRGYYRMLATRFPFAIYYRTEKETIKVHAVLDCRRAPTWTRKRLKKEGRSD
jgi:plasmid stabilization system protein ParE